METTTSGRPSVLEHQRKSRRGAYGLDTTVALDINGTRQRLRICAERSGLPPLLISQAGPGLSVINDAPRFQECLGLEDHFSVAYWDQRGCGPAPLRDARDVTLDTQVDDLRAVVRWLAERAGQPVVVLGISLGATIALLAAEREPGKIKALIAVSIDTDIPAGDAAALSFLQEAGARADGRKIAKSLEKLGAPPYTTLAPFQLRARLLANLGGVEHGKRFGEILRGTLYSLVRAYGLIGAAKSLRNMNAVQRKMLPQMATLNLFTHWPRPAIPIHYVFGGGDPLIPPSLVQAVSRVASREDTVVVLPDSGHMAHFDQPATVRSIVVQAHTGA